MAIKSICSIEGCGKAAHARSYCANHYARWLRHGDASACARPANGTVGKYLRDTVLHYEGDDCLIWPFSTNRGYAQMCVSGTKPVGVHRLVCELTHGPAPSPIHQAAHSCGNGKNGCVSKRHLLWKTPTENQADRLVHGTDGRGERCATAKLTESDVRRMRALLGALPQHSIAQQFGISDALVSMIKTGKVWGWLHE